MAVGGACTEYSGGGCGWSGRWLVPPGNRPVLVAGRLPAARSVSPVVAVRGGGMLRGALYWLFYHSLRGRYWGLCVLLRISQVVLTVELSLIHI